jgi:hypothetical protein
MQPQDFYCRVPRLLSPADYAAGAQELGVTVAHIATVAEVESRGAGYLTDGRPKILYEAHIFSRLTGHRFDASHLQVSSKAWNRSLYRGGAGEYDRLAEAMSLDENAALQSASWGCFQIMGMNHQACGFPTVQDFVRAHVVGGEPAHLAALCSFLKSTGLVKPLAARDWATFARGYNGPAQVPTYGGRLAAAFAKHSAAQGRPA